MMTSKYRYVIVQQDKPNTLLPYGVEIYKNLEVKPYKSYWFKTPEERLEGLKIVAKTK